MSRKNPASSHVSRKERESIPTLLLEPSLIDNPLFSTLFENSSHRRIPPIPIAIKSAGQFWPATRNCFVLIDRRTGGWPRPFHQSVVLARIISIAKCQSGSRKIDWEILACRNALVTLWNEDVGDIAEKGGVKMEKKNFANSLVRRRCFFCLGNCDSLLLNKC